MELAEYLLQEKDLAYVLLGKINSDPLERRFGWYRQLAGANYFISVRQFLEAEKKIRLRCLVKFEKLSLSEVSDVFQEGEDEKSDRVECASQDVLAALPSESFSSQMQLNGEEGVVYYIAGYIARGLLKRSSCESCPEVIIKSRDAPNIEISDEDDAEEREEFMRSVNRGGLVTPSELVYIICVHAMLLREDIFDGGEIQKFFRSFEFPRSVFVSVLQKKLDNTPESDKILNQTCNDAHSFSKFIPDIARRFFTCLSKNFTSSLNDKIHASRKRGPRNDASDSSATRKITKLQSKSR